MGSLLLLDRQEQLEFWGEFFLGIEPIGEVDPSDSAVGVDCDSKGFNVVTAIGSPGEIGQVELNLIPSLIQPHGHSTDEGLHSRGRLVVRGSEPSADVFVVKYLDFKGEVLFKLSGWRCTFLMIMTKKGSLIPKVSFYCCGQVMKAVVTLVPIISRTDD